jgi:predicted nucleic acid-binding protein
VDRVSFELMRRRHIDGAFAFDPDFTDHGFTTIP